MNGTLSYTVPVKCKITVLPLIDDNFIIKHGMCGVSKFSAPQICPNNVNLSYLL